MFPLKDSISISCVPFITWLIIAANVIFFGIELCVPHEEIDMYLTSFGVVPSIFMTHFGWAQFGKIISSMFLHAGFAHLAGNMWFLCIFGDAVEDAVGHLSYLFLYMFGGLCAAIAQIAVDPSSGIPMIGASGAISAVLGAYLFLYPRASVSTILFVGFFLRIVELPAPFYLGLWFLVQLLSGVLSLAGAEEGIPSVAFWAHGAGFLFGLLAARTLVRIQCLARRRSEQTAS